MPAYVVRRRVDAYVDYIAQVIADDPVEAAEIAREHENELAWTEDGVCEFDDRLFITLDAQGYELEQTETRR